MSSSAGPDPSRYFSSHGGLSDSLDSAGDVMDGHGRPSGEFKKRLDSVRARLLASFESGAPEERRNLTVYTGRAGYAYMYHRLALIDEHNRSDHLAKAESHLSPCLKRLSGSRISFLCGDPGPLALGAAVASLKGDSVRCEDLCDRLDRFAVSAAKSGSSNPDELLYGRSGCLWAVLFARQHCPEKHVDDDTIRTLVQAILDSGKEYSRQNHSNTPLMYEWHGKEYLGAAHGLAGILYVLLLARDFVSDKDLADLVKPSVDGMMGDQLPSGNFRSSVGSDRDKLVQFCHGAPGVIHLYLKAAEVFREDAGKYLKVAEQCGEVIWKAGVLKKGYGICHGTAGNAYGFLALSAAQAGDARLVSRLRGLRFARWCCDYGDHGCPQPDEPYCLMNGMAGTVLFLNEVRFDRAVFPAFCMDEEE